MWTRFLLKPLLTHQLAAFLLLGLSGVANAETWTQLSPIQQQALAPLAHEWNALPAKRQQHYLALAKKYTTLPPEKQAAFIERLAKWNSLTPEQRHKAREKFTHFNNVPVEKKEAVKRMIKEKETGQNSGASSSAQTPSDH